MSEELNNKNSEQKEQVLQESQKSRESQERQDENRYNIETNDSDDVSEGKLEEDSDALRNEEQKEQKGEGEREEESELLVTIGDEESNEEEIQKAPEWVRKVRKDNRSLSKENRELKKKLDEITETSENIPGEPGRKPILEDFDYDTDLYEQKLDDWYRRKNEYDELLKSEEQKKEKEAQNWQKVIDSYNKKRNELGANDYEEAEEAIKEAFDTVQQSMILQGADNPALVVYALGRNPDKLKELSETKEPVKFAFKIAKLESQMKVTKRKARTQPERSVVGNASASGSIDSALEKLREKAAATGDYTEVIKYKAAMKK